MCWCAVKKLPYSLTLWPMCNEGITQFYLPPKHCLPLLPSCKMSPPFGWYLLCLPTKWWPVWVDLGGWLHIEINVWHRKLNLDTVTHPSTKWARHRLTLLIETNSRMSLLELRCCCAHNVCILCSLCFYTCSQQYISDFIKDIHFYHQL